MWSVAAGPRSQRDSTTPCGPARWDSHCGSVLSGTMSEQLRTWRSTSERAHELVKPTLRSADVEEPGPRSVCLSATSDSPWDRGPLKIGDWWAVQVRLGRERSAAAHLSSRGYETFLPCYLHRR